MLESEVPTTTTTTTTKIRGISKEKTRHEETTTRKNVRI